MNKVRKQFVLYAMLAVFVLLTVILGIINGTSFTMAAADADAITAQLAENSGKFGPEVPGLPQGIGHGRMDQMGPNSPELGYTTRYFTVRFDAEGHAEVVSFAVAAVSEEEAVSWAQGLIKETTGWTRSSYRYRVYEKNGATYVTVIDQGRELLASYRILIISLIGIALGLLISFLFLHLVSKKLFAPLEEADRKQKNFLAEAERKFKVPLTVIHADTELIERENGPSDYTTSINRQVKKMTALVKELGALSIYEEAGSGELCSLTDLWAEAADSSRDALAVRGIELSCSLEPGVTEQCDSELMRRVAQEVLENAVKFAQTRVDISLRKEGDRIVLSAMNDTTLPDGNVERVFDRFTTLENAGSAGAGSGLGLAFVKDAVKSMGGRVSASVADGIFTLKLFL